MTSVLMIFDFNQFLRWQKAPVASTSVNGLSLAALEVCAGRPLPGCAESRYSSRAAVLFWDDSEPQKVAPIRADAADRSAR